MRKQTVHVWELVQKTNYKKVALGAITIAWVLTLIVLSLYNTEQEPVAQHNAPWISPELTQELKEATKQLAYWNSKVTDLETKMIQEIDAIGDWVDSGVIEAEAESDLLFLPK